MREIKFRGKRIDNGEWVYGYLYIEQGVLEPNYYIVKYDSLAKTPDFLQIIPKTANQYTNLKDKDGKEIYEGDIVNMYNDVGEVYFECGKQMVMWEKMQEKQDLCLVDLGVEVIGDIYENPELLGKEQTNDKNKD